MKRNPKVCAGCRYLNTDHDFCNAPIACDDEVLRGMFQTLILMGHIGTDCVRWMEHVVMNQVVEHETKGKGLRGV